MKSIRINISYSRHVSFIQNIETIEYQNNYFTLHDVDNILYNLLNKIEFKIKLICQIQNSKKLHVAEN